MHITLRQAIEAAKQRQVESAMIIHPKRISSRVQMEVAMCGYNLYAPKHVEYFDQGSEIWKSEEIPEEGVFFMHNTADIVAYLRTFIQERSGDMHN